MDNKPQIPPVIHAFFNEQSYTSNKTGRQIKKPVINKPSFMIGLGCDIKKKKADSNSNIDL